MPDEMTRRQLLRTGALGGAALGLSSLAPQTILDQALAVAPRCGRVQDIEHVVILMQENRSFDHYFGSYRGVRGFRDPRAERLHDGSGKTVFAQPGYDRPGYGGHLMPFHLDSQHDGECTDDVIHSWGAQHRSWNGGRMDRFVREHLADDPDGELTMGYYTRRDLSFYYALADAFTICDDFFCSVMGPTDPNRLYAMSGMLDPAGRHGGPLLETLVATRAAKTGAFRWTTMPEQLSARGISWKNYTSLAGGQLQNVLPYFRNYSTDPKLAARGIAPTYPADFLADVARGELPQVSWVLPQLLQTEHPPTPTVYGEYATAQVLSTLTANPKLWAKTVLFVTYDENGGFFDHVPPPTPPAGTRGEFVTVNPLPAAAEGDRGPIGLGFRVPTLVVSPFARGGFVSSETFDHTSILRFLETRFGAEVPNLTPWRRSVTGDMTSAFNFAHPDRSVPRLPRPSLADSRVTPANGCPPSGKYPVPPNGALAQESGRAKRPSGVCSSPAPHRPSRRRRPRHRHPRSGRGPSFTG